MWEFFEVWVKKSCKEVSDLFLSVTYVHYKSWVSLNLLTCLRYYKFKLMTCMRDSLCFKFLGKMFLVCLVGSFLPLFLPVSSKFSSVFFYRIGLYFCILTVWIQLVKLSLQASLLGLPCLMDSLLSFSLPTTIKMEGLISRVGKFSVFW